MTSLLISDCSNEIFEYADAYTTTPSPEDVRVKDPEVFMVRLGEIDSPSERLSLFLRSTLDPTIDSTHESKWIHNMVLTASLGGWFIGGVLNSKDILDSYVRRHNAAIFANKARARISYVDSYFFGTARRGLKYGLYSGLLIGSAGLIGLGSINYRNKLYLPDWIIGFSALGSASRCWLGMRGVIGGGGLGFVAGLLGYGLVRLSELMTGQPVAYWRHLSHQDFMKQRQFKHEYLQRIQQEGLKDKKF